MVMVMLATKSMRRYCQAEGRMQSPIAWRQSGGLLMGCDITEAEWEVGEGDLEENEDSSNNSS